MVGKKRNTRILVNVPTSNVLWGIRSKTKILGLQNLQPQDLDAGSGHSCRARIIHHGANEVLVQQDSVSDGEITFPVQEGTQRTHHLNSFLPDLIDVRCVVYLGLLPDNEFCRRTGLVPRKVSLVGTG